MTLLRSGISISKRSMISYAFLFFYLLAFYYIITVFFPGSFIPADYRLITKIALNLNICAVIVFGSFIIKRINGVYFAYAAPLAVTALSLLLYFTSGLFQTALVFVTSTIFGIGTVLFFRYFWRGTNSIDRARVAGIIAFCVLPFLFILQLIPPYGLGAQYLITLVIALNLGIIFLIRFGPKTSQETTVLGNNRFFEKRIILLYAIPWILFSLLNVTLAKDISINVANEVPISFHVLLIGLQAIGVNVGAILAGFLADTYGRRVTLAVSLTLYGISAVIGGIFLSEAAFSALYLINGLTWGILFVLYFFVIFGDLSNMENSPKIYSIGLVTYFLSVAIGEVYQAFLPIILSSLLTCLLLFLSIVPIFIAPELLTSDLREKMKLEKYVKRLKKVQKNQG